MTKTETEGLTRCRAAERNCPAFLLSTNVENATKAESESELVGSS